MSTSMLKLRACVRTGSALAGAVLLAACYANNNSNGSSNASGANKFGANIAPAVTLSISPNKLTVGQGATATWDASDATTCKALGAWSGAMPLYNETGQAVGPFTAPGLVSFSLSCTGPGGSAVAEQLVTVGNVPAPTIEMNIVPGTITPGNSAWITWSTTNATACTGSGGTPASGWQGSQATSNMAGYAVGIVNTSGAYQFDLTCIGSGGSTEAERVLTVTPTAPTPAPALVLAVQPAQIAPGQATTLSWDSSYADTCTASGGSGGDKWQGTEPISSSGVSTGAISTAGSYSFTLTCTGTGGTTAKSVTVAVTPTTEPPVISVSIAVSPSQIVSGGVGYLTWATANADACVASGSWSGVKPVLGTLITTGTLTTPGLYSYTLKCSGVGGSANGTATLTVAEPPAVINSFAVTPDSIQTGQSAALAWTTQYATACTGLGGTGSDGWTGARAASDTAFSTGIINTAGIYIYTLDCSGPGGPSIPESTTVTVTSPTPAVPSISVFAAAPSNITVGQSASLSWTTVGATSCAATGGTGHDGWSGSVGIDSVGTSTGAINTAGSYTYTLTCAGPGGTSVPAWVIVNVSNAAPAPAVVTSFSATPLTIQTGQSATLAWTTDGATSCTGTNGTGSWAAAQATSSTGTSTGAITSAGLYTYTLTCSGPGGSSSPRSATFTVTSAPAAAAVSSFTVTPALIQTGQSASLAWTSSNATSCTASGGTGSWTGSVGTSSAGTSTGVINMAGTYTYTLNCTGASGSAGPSSVILLVTAPVSAPASIVAFAVTPSTIETGQSAELTWVTASAATCTGSGGTGTWAGPVATTSLGTNTGVIATANSYTYTLTCNGPGGSSGPNSVALNVTSAPPPLPVISIFAAAPSTVQTGQDTTLTWTAVGATSCAATGAWSGSVGITGTDVVGPLNTAGDFTYTLTCSGTGGTSTPKSVTVDVNSIPPAPTVQSFTVTPNTVQQGGSVTAAWSTSGATSCTASGGTPSDGWSGTEPSQSTATGIGPINTVGVALYALTCTGPGGTSLPSTASVLVSVTAPPASVTSFSASPSAIQVGQSTQLTWATSNATSCTAGGGTGSWNGSERTSSTGTSSGVINTAGIYTYDLTCTGAGGSSLPATAIVTVTSAPPPVTVTSFTATPSVLQVGQSTQLAWSTNGATACTASGGTGSDGWSGTEAPSSTGVTVGPINALGIYAYTLVCTGPGGTSLPTSLIVTVDQAAPAASITAFTATPSFVTAGQSTSLAWSTSNASSCTAGGGSGSDGWSGTVGTTSTGQRVGPLSAGTITYSLTCTGPGGTSAPSSLNVTVNPSAAPAPTVTLVANGASPVTVQPGAALALSWSSSNATSCSASGGPVSGGWSGSKPTSSTGMSVTAVSVPGTYSYTLTCGGSGGTGSSTVNVTVISSQSYDCGIPGLPTAALVTSQASITSSVSGVCLLDCSISNTGNIVDSNPDNYASLSIPLGLLGSETLTVTDSVTYPSGRTVGFIVANGSTVLDVGLLSGVTVQTLLKGTVQDTATTSSLLTLNAAGLLAVDPDAGYAEFKTTKYFDTVQLIAGSVVALNTNLRVYSACVSQQ